MSLISRIKAVLFELGIGENTFSAMVGSLTLILSVATLIILYKNLQGLNKANEQTHLINKENNRAWFQVSLLPEYDMDPGSAHYFTLQLENRGNTAAVDIELEVLAGKPPYLTMSGTLTPEWYSHPVRVNSSEYLENYGEEYRAVHIGRDTISVFPPKSKKNRVYKFKYTESLVLEIEDGVPPSTPINNLTDFNIYVRYSYIDTLAQKKVEIEETFQLTLDEQKPPGVLVTPLFSGDTYVESDIKK